MTIVYAVLLLSLLLLGVFALAFSRMFGRLWAPTESEETVAEWLDDFSVARYGPMQRLLGEADYCFLRSQPGYRPALERELRSQRKQIFRDYLSLMSLDFHHLLGLANLLMIHSVEDRPDLAKQLFRQRLTFYWAMCAIECRLTVAPGGLAGVDVQGLVGTLEGLRQQVAQLVPEPTWIEA